MPVAPETGSIRVTTTTKGVEGSLDWDGFTVAVEGLSARPIDNNGTMNFFDLSLGNHVVVLDGVAENCVIEGEHPRGATVFAGATVDVAFMITCAAATGTLVVRTGPRGGAGPDGYRVSIDGGDFHALGISEERAFTVSAGRHEVLLDGMAMGCTVTSLNPRTETVRPFLTSTIIFTVHC